MGVTLRFPGPAAFAPAQQIVARTTELLNGLNRRWAVRYDFAATRRAPPRTLRPRKGPAPAQPTVAEVIGHFIRRRDMFALDDAQISAIGQVLVTDAVAAVRAGGAMPSASTLMLRFADLHKGLVVHRWERGGDDLELDPLSPGYVRYKTRLGYPARIGTLTGQSLAALKRVRVVAVRL